MSNAWNISSFIKNLTSVHLISTKKKIGWYSYYQKFMTHLFRSKIINLYLTIKQYFKTYNIHVATFTDDAFIFDHKKVSFYNISIKHWCVQILCLVT